MVAKPKGSEDCFVSITDSQDNTLNGRSQSEPDIALIGLIDRFWSIAVIVAVRAAVDAFNSSLVCLGCS